MNIRILSLTAIALGVMLVLTAGAGARADRTEVVRKAGTVTVLAALRASEEVPPPTGAEAARGGIGSPAPEGWTFVASVGGGQYAMYYRLTSR